MEGKNFGKYGVLAVVEHYFELEPSWVWKIRPPTTGDEAHMQQFMLYERVSLQLDGSRTERPPTRLEVAIREISLLFAGTTVPKDPDKPEEGPLLPDDAALHEIELVLNTMPEPMVMEIWNKIHEIAPGWGPGVSPLEDPKASLKNSMTESVMPLSSEIAEETAT